MKRLPQHNIKFSDTYGLNLGSNNDSFVNPINYNSADTHDDFTTDVINFPRKQIKPTSMAPDIKQPIGARILSPSQVQINQITSTSAFHQYNNSSVINQLQLLDAAHTSSFSATGQTKKRASRGTNQIDPPKAQQKSITKQILNGTRSLTRTQSNLQQSQNTSRVADTLETIKALNTQVKIKKQSVQQNRSKAEMPETPKANKKNEKNVQMRKQLCSYDQEFKSVMDIDSVKQKNRYQI